MTLRSVCDSAAINKCSVFCLLDFPLQHFRGCALAPSSPGQAATGCPVPCVALWILFRATETGGWTDLGAMQSTCLMLGHSPRCCWGPCTPGLPQSRVSGLEPTEQRACLFCCPLPAVFPCSASVIFCWDSACCCFSLGVIRALQFPSYSKSKHTRSIDFGPLLLASCFLMETLMLPSFS